MTNLIQPSDGKSLKISLPREVRLFSIVSLTLSAICIFIECVICRPMKLPSIYVWPVMPFRHWRDFEVFFERFRSFHHLGFFTPAIKPEPNFMYPAPAAVVYEIFYKVPWHPLWFFLCVTLACEAFAIIMFGRKLHRMGLSVATTAVFLGLAWISSYPFWFEFLLGNIEVCVWILVGAGVWAFFRDKTYTAATFFAIAGAIKVYPLLYLGLLFAQKRYKAVAYATGLFVAINVASLWLVYPNILIASRGIAKGLNQFRSAYVLPIRPMETGFDHSAFGLVKRFLSIFHHLDVGQGFLRIDHIATIYGIAALVFACALYFMRIRYLPVANQLLSLCILSILLPPTSHDYTLLHLYFPWAIMVILAIRNARAGNTVPGFTCEISIGCCPSDQERRS